MRDMADNETGDDNRDIARRRIKKCLEAYTRAMNPDFADFWERTAREIAKNNCMDWKECLDA